MDGLITAIIAGVVATVIGAILAFYFGGVRETQKQAYEKQREEAKRQEEKRREEEIVQNRLRANALDAIRAQVRPLATAYDDWVEKCASFSYSPDWGYTFGDYDKVVGRMNEISSKA